MRVKISLPGHYRKADLTQFLGRDFDPRVRFFLNKSVSNADAWFVIEGTNEDDRECVVPRNRIYFLGAETARPLGFFYSNREMKNYLRQFTEIHGPQDLFEDNAFLTYPFLPWMVNANHGSDLFNAHPRDIDFFRSLQAVDKNKNLSVICSSKSDTPEHAARFHFVKRLKEHFGDRMDWFGNGVSPISSKWDGLGAYRYSVVLENQSSSHVLTEKIQDAFLCLTLPFYWGAPEARTLFPENSFVPINLKDVRGAITTIEKTLEEDPYQNRVDDLIVAKRVVTDELNFLYRIRKLATRDCSEPALPPSKVKLMATPRAWREKIRWKARRFLRDMRGSAS